MNDQFYEDAADAAVIAQQIMMFDRGIISGEEIRDSLKNVAVLPLDNDVPEPEALDPLQGVDKPQPNGVVLDTTAGGRDPSTGIMPNELA